MNLVESLQVQSLLSVVNEEGDYLLRRIFRWYSTTFHTPLHTVEELPLEYVLQHYFEHAFESMTPAKRNKLIKELTETPEERKVRLAEEKRKAEAESEEAFIKEILEKEKKETTRRKKKIEQVTKEVEEQGAKEFLAEAVKQMAVVAGELRANAPAAVPVPELPDMPDISMDFSDNLGDSDSLSPFKKE